MALVPSPPCRPLIEGPARQAQLDFEPDDIDQLVREVLKQRLVSIPSSLASHVPLDALPVAIVPQTGRVTVRPPGPSLEVPGCPSSSALVPFTSPSPPKPTTSSGPLLLEAPKDQRQRWAAILAADPNFAHFIRPLHEDLSAALTPYTPQDGLKAALPPYTLQDDDARGEEGAMVPTPLVAEEQAEQVVKKAGGLEELIAFAEALCLRAEKGDLMTGGGPTEVSPVCKARTVDMELRMEVRTQGLQGHGGRPTGKVAVGAKVRAYSPQLLREYPSNVGGEGGVRRAPIILVELTDAHLEQAVTRFFRLYEELYDLQCPDYERPTLFIFADLTSTRLSHRQQLDLLKKIGARLQQLEQEGKPAYREAASRVFFNDANAHIQGLSLASSNDLILSTIRRSSVCGLNFLRCMTGRDVLRLCRYKVGDAAEEEGRQLMNGGEVSRGLGNAESHRKGGPTQETESQGAISSQGDRKSLDKKGSLRAVTGAGEVADGYHYEH